MPCVHTHQRPGSRWPPPYPVLAAQGPCAFSFHSVDLKFSANTSVVTVPRLSPHRRRFPDPSRNSTVRFLYGICLPGAGSLPVTAHHLRPRCQTSVQLLPYSILFILGTHAPTICFSVSLVLLRGGSFIHKSMFSLIFNQTFNLHIVPKYIY